MVEWIKQGNNYWVWARGQFRSPFDQEVKKPPEIPSLPGISAWQGAQFCVLDFPRSMIPSLRYGTPPGGREGVDREPWSAFAWVGEGGHQYLAGTYEYHWAGGDWVDKDFCSLHRNASHTFVEGSFNSWAWKWGDSVHLERGKPFTVKLEPGHSPVLLLGPCEGALYRVGE